MPPGKGALWQPAQDSSLNCGPRPWEGDTLRENRNVPKLVMSPAILAVRDDGIGIAPADQARGSHRVRHRLRHAPVALERGPDDAALPTGSGASPLEEEAG